MYSSINVYPHRIDLLRRALDRQPWCPIEFGTDGCLSRHPVGIRSCLAGLVLRKGSRDRGACKGFLCVLTCRR
jgi:hypothetical protein